MIRNYKLFLLKEGVNLSNNDVIDIIKALETEDNRNSKLINKLVNNADNRGKTVLMSIVQQNDEELVDYILKFNIDINQVNKNNENVLFYCKNVKMFNKFYNMGADVTLISNDGRNLMLALAKKNIFNYDLYKRLIDDGIDINKRDKYNTSILKSSIFNQKILNLLFDNNVDIDSEVIIRDKDQKFIIKELLYAYQYFPKKRSMIINKFKYLNDKGMLIKDNLDFIIDKLADSLWQNKYQECVLNFFKELSSYFDLMVALKKLIMRTSNNIPFVIEILEYQPSLFKFVKQHYGEGVFNLDFGEFMKKHPYLEDSDKYNI